MGEIKRDTLAVVVRCHVNVAEFVWSGFVCRDRDQFAWNAQRRKKARAVHREPIAVLNSDAGFLNQPRLVARADEHFDSILSDLAVLLFEFPFSFWGKLQILRDICVLLEFDARLDEVPNPLDRITPLTCAGRILPDDFALRVLPDQTNYFGNCESYLTVRIFGHAFKCERYTCAEVGMVSGVHGTKVLVLLAFAYHHAIVFLLVSSALIYIHVLSAGTGGGAPNG